MRVGPIRLQRGVGRNLAPVQRDNTHLHQPRLPTKSEHLHAQRLQCLALLLPKSADRRVIRRLVRRNNAKPNVPLTQCLDRPQRANPQAVGIQKSATIIEGSKAACPFPSARYFLVEGRKVHRVHRINDDPRQIFWRKPIV